MKKGLSVLLIVAALFGFYGGATSLNDILASKDYWEEVGEQSTADMNKLEDGLNQLKDNEQAYLDGKEQLAEGEKTLADGEAQYAQGLADYAAAPGKLAAGRAAIAKGESDLASLYTLIDGMKSLINGFEKPQGDAPMSLKDGYQKLRDGRDGLLKTIKSGTVDDMLADVALLLDDPAVYQSGIITLQKQASKEITRTNADYKEFIDALEQVKPGLEEAKTKLEGGSSAVSALSSTTNTLESDYNAFLVAYAKAQQTGDPADIAAANAAKDTLTETTTAVGGYFQVAAPMLVKFGGVSQTDNNLLAAASELTTAAGGGQPNFDVLIDALKALKGNMSAAVTNIASTVGTLNTYIGMATEAIDGYPVLAGDTAMKGRDTMAYGVQTLVTKVYASKNKKLISGLEKAGRAAGISNVKSFAASMVKDRRSMDDFHNNMEKACKAFKIALPQLNKTAADGEKTLAAGKKTLKQGEADYAAAPGKLADAEKLLEEGRKQLADGKAQLAQYEDGEQQIRDGLATLMATEPDPGLTSIFDRLKDDDFDNGDTHLEIEEGLNAVEVGRGYQADSGALITKEITNRAIGTAAGLAAGALAVLAAILSFLKKNKGAGVSALIAAAAGLLGCFVGMGAGEYYSDIAGSTVGNLPFIAAGVLGAVAIVFAVVHFQAKPEAKAEAK